MKTYLEEIEENNEATVVEAEPVAEAPVEDPAAIRRSKNAKRGLLIPAIVMGIIGIVFCLFSWLMWQSARECLQSEDAAAAIIGGLILLVLYFACAVLALVLNLPSIILTIVCLAKRSIKGNKVLAIVILAISSLAFISIIAGFFLLAA